ncbi:MAG: DUF2442 domain-containing protein [Synechocystis sp.]
MPATTRHLRHPGEHYHYFAQVKVNPELGTIQWPNGADLDPDVLYDLISHGKLSAK